MHHGFKTCLQSLRWPILPVVGVIVSMTFHMTFVHIILVRLRLVSGHLLGNSFPLG